MQMMVEGEDRPPEEFSAEFGWQSAVSKRMSAKVDSANRPGGGIWENRPNAGASFRTQDNRHKLKSKIIRASRMPPMPKEHAKIVMRPRGGLNIAKAGPTVIAARSRISCSNVHRKSPGSDPDPGDALAPEGAPGDALDPEGALVPEPEPDPAPGVAPDPGAEAVKSGSSPARGPAPGIADPSATRPGPTEFEERRKTERGAHHQSMIEVTTD
ncbi:hypothetical protein HPB49_004065 [Dermacentor silvarum]|uniref:Uncharacterized protein n=1 Tax=Dermacentor silvarum TaxID=543639 RepID=A0ACB8DMM9_DERSI|nr:hypothetical protein HPB49_004065 [Dermacentor silvarum]